MQSRFLFSTLEAPRSEAVLGREGEKKALLFEVFEMTAARTSGPANSFFVCKHPFIDKPMS